MNGYDEMIIEKVQKSRKTSKILRGKKLIVENSKDQEQNLDPGKHLSNHN